MSSEIKHHLEILELRPGATYPQINQAYHRLKNIYSTESSILSPLTKEFSKKKSNDILRRIEKAHKFLTSHIESVKTNGENHEEPPTDTDPEKSPQKILPFSGRNLRKIRTALGISLSDISLETKIRIELLKDIENDHYDALPDEIYLRAHIRYLAKILGLNPHKAAEDYLQLFRMHKEAAGEKR
ncbi:MAG: helix-turn-helix domain-containing protein [Acidobacteria bacterium]|nr:helix-turn-helix domain-containing protein [Acidobacteriota bacterium]MBU4253976.1 helix-turn-helix domain-containing protein [Acidobacteriota bacterium]MBU4329394.1 helix-turn-helix domain-containing protein [Acidobacteriota bacterium]MCG2815368.1 helix-turn-helix domain-containing protein [Candidatus Aminicenantes bacterium]